MATETTVLSEEEIAEIEAHFHLTTDGDAVFVLSRAPALCATVKALRAESAEWERQARLNQKAFGETLARLSEVERELKTTKQHRDDLIAELEKLK